MTPISAVIITLNEADNIGRCLKSLAGLVDEVVVVDSLSTDKTEEICTAHGARFLQRKWAGYAPTKNWANQQATHQYILSIDADEEVDSELKETILNAAKSGLSGAYELQRKTNYCGHWVKHCGWYPDRKIRIFDKSDAKWTGDFVHEELELAPEVAVQTLNGHLLHYSYHHLSDHRDRAKKYAKLHAQKMAANNRNSSIFKATASAVWKFFQVYFIRLGFLDGIAGWHIARFSAYAVFLKYKNLRVLNKSKIQ